MIRCAMVLLSLLWASTTAFSQAVRVTLQLDTNRVSIGQTTRLRVLAEIAPDVRPESMQIFSWYLNLENSSPAVANANYAAMDRGTSDHDPSLSSSGVTVGANRHGIYDTLMGSPGAGKNAPVELFSVPVSGVALGNATFRVVAGSGVDGLSADFIVAPEGGGDPFTGGDYSSAAIRLDVVRATVQPAQLRVTQAPLAGGRARVTISYAVQPNAAHYLEFRNTLANSWQTLPGGPHNLGTVTETNALPTRFYRLRVTPQ